MSYRPGDDILRFAPSFLPFTFVYLLVLPAVKAFDRLVFRLRVVGRENLEGLRRAVLVSNHTLLMDPAVIAHAIRPRRTYFTMLEETALFPFLGTFVRLLGAIPIPEYPASVRILEKSMARAFSHLGFVHFFPEGECYRWNQQVRPLRLGAFALAARLGVPVVPVTTVIHERRWLGRSSFAIFGRRLRVPPRVTVVIDEPVHAARFAERVDAAGGARRQGGQAGEGSQAGEGGVATRQASGPSRRSLVQMSRWVRRRMQASIDSAGGSKGLYRGQMPRLSRLIPVDDSPK